MTVTVSGDSRLVHCHAGCSQADVISRLGERGLWPTRPTNGNGSGNGRQIVATYDYADADGELLYQAVRFAPKGFCQRRPDGAGGWVWNLSGVDRVPYRLPELVAADRGTPIYIVEGEKDADRLASLGLLATCNAGGAGKWRNLDDSALHDRIVRIIPDNDEPGRNHAHQVAASLHGRAADVRIVELPGLPDGGDVSDWVNEGGTADGLLERGNAAQLYAPNEGPSIRIDDSSDANSRPTIQTNRRPNVEPYQPFPTDILPGAIAQFVHETADAIGCDPALVALPVLSVLGSSIGTTRSLKLKASWQEFPIVWTCTIGRSGGLKTPAMDAALRPLHRAQLQRLREHDQAIEYYETQLLRYERELATWRKCKNEADPPRKPSPPTAVRYVVSDTTVEALIPILEANQRGTLSARDELRAWFASFNQYKGGQGGDVCAWLELWRAGTLIVDRKGHRKTTHIPRAAVSVCGGIQPGVLASLGSVEYLDSGLIPRVLWAHPPEKMKKWTNRTPSAGTLSAYENTIQNLVNLSHVETEYGPESVCLSLAADAQSAWENWYNRS